jgi:hypothetical protein
MSESQASKEELFWFGYDNVKAKEAGDAFTREDKGELAPARTSSNSPAKTFQLGCFAPRLRIVA